MLLEKIPLGRTLEIFVERDEYRYRLVSKVEDTNSQRVCVSAIASNGRFFMFQPTDKIRLIYRDQEVMWEWTNVKAGLAKLDGDPVHYFMITDPGKSFNRRNAYRVRLLEDSMFGYYAIPGKPEKYADVPSLPPEEEGRSEQDEQELLEAVRQPHMVKGLIKDVSENGVGIYCNIRLELDDSLFFDIPSPYGNLSVKALVVRKVPMQDYANRYDYYYGCVLLRSDRRLLRYIFDLQRELIKKQRM
ncbi:MAG: PilZ domain-containing protein [Clostridiaceae bacterium]|nr:PilZ domain-containing protein [Clostridiaceae bacterium]